MKYFSLFLVVIAMLLTAGCNNDISNDTEAGMKFPSVNLPTVTTPSENINSFVDSSTNGKASPILSNQNTLAGNELNPAHGKPGHRCDIPVGSPLNSKPSQASTDNQPVITNQQQSIVPVTASGLNPAHGKPGHRCDIAIGAPLNSKPAQPARATQSVIPTTANAQQGTTVSPVLPTTASSTELNPEHGKPGHRCDIAVGAPLNDKPKQ